MKSVEFFRDARVHRLLSRGAHAAAAPVRIHCVAGGEEGPALAEFGVCEACRYVNGFGEGRAACRASRLDGSLSALVRGTTTVFVCHMGFACVAVPALPEPEADLVMVLGPYCPAEEPRALESDALRGLAALGVAPGDAFPVSLHDVRIVPKDSLPALADWLAESVAWLWHEWGAEDDRDEVAPPIKSDERRGRVGIGRRPAPDPYHGADIAVALAGGDQTQARALFRAVLAERSAEGRQARIDIRRARTVAAVCSVLERAEQADLDVRRCWDGFEEFVGGARSARTDEALVSAAVRLLASVRRAAQRSSASEHSFVELNERVMARFPDKVLLRDIAGELGLDPTAITHRLQRKFGMSFTEYVGRLRVDKAKELLRRTRLSVTEVARRVGIADVSNLGKLFRRFEGMSPLDYRKQFGNRS